MTRRSRIPLILAVVTASGCAVAVPGSTPGGARARLSPTDRDPVGFLLLNRDSIGLADSVVQRLVQLNLRLFRRNQALQIQIDSLLRNVRQEPRGRGDSAHAMPPEIKQRLDPLNAQIFSQTAAVKDTAWSWLTETQRARADSLDARQLLRLRSRS